MAGEKFSIEVDSGFVENFFGLADMMPPQEITVENLNDAIKAIKQKFDSALLSQSSLIMSAKPPENTADISTAIPSPGKTVNPVNIESQEEIENSPSRPKSVLIVDDLGIITYQLEILFKKLGFETTVSRELYNAIDQYKKKDFGYVVLDLFIPTEREGLMLLDEIKRLALFCKLNTKIIMMSASSKTEYRDKCLSRGADCYVEKTTGWQKDIINACLNK